MVALAFVFLILAFQPAMSLEEERYTASQEPLYSTVTVTEVIKETTTVYLDEKPLPTIDPGSSGWNRSCGGSFFDADRYVCREGNTLCPIINDEGFALCGRACYSRLMYECKNSKHLSLLPERKGHAVLHVYSPRHPRLHGKPVTVCNNQWRVGGKTCSYCPESMGLSCPPGGELVINAGRTASMAVLVPGGQKFYLDGMGRVGVATAHSGNVPPGAKTDGFRAFEGGGLFYVGDDGRGNGMKTMMEFLTKERRKGAKLGWLACGKGPMWELKGRMGSRSWNETDVGCVGVNLRVGEYDGLGAWEYT